MNAPKAYDTTGVVTELPLDHWLPIDSITLAPYPRGRDTITITVRGRPELAGIDPRHLFDWEEGEDDNNVEPVLITGAP